MLARNRLRKINVGAEQMVMGSSPSSSHGSNLLSPVESLNEKKSTSKAFFSRRQKPSPSISSSRTFSPSTSDMNTASPTSPPSSLGSLYDPKITQGLQDDAVRAKDLQSSSSLLGRLKWATEDRGAFFSAIEELAHANDLLENLLRIKAPEDDTFLARGQENDQTTCESIKSIRASLEKLHQDLLAANPNGREVEYCLKLALEGRGKESYADYVDEQFDSSSAVYSLQAHMKKKYGNNSYYLLAETAIGDETRVPVISNVATAVSNIDPNADPPLQCLGGNTSQEGNIPKLRIYQDKTSHWTKTQTLAKALQDQSFQDICFQKHYIQLGLFSAFSYAVLPFTFKGKTKFPQTSNYIYYDQVSGEPLESNIAESSDSTSKAEEDDSRTHRPDSSDPRSISDPSIEERFQDLQSPYINFGFGSRPPSISTKALGKRPGFTAPTNNALVSLGLLLYQIGSWQAMPSGDIVQMRRDALDRTHDLIRLSGVEFADITRACLNWKESTAGGKRGDVDDMLVKIYARLEEYNKGLQELI
ncbi:hypothetical protein BGZ57DRAFT_27118 [Hyaloscypha finlandica]|nr:hypothetical protein BGZ57DRAFT_27118 [Hyaloscypha finlandica]